MQKKSIQKLDRYKPGFQMFPVFGCLLFRSPLYRQDLVVQIWKPDFGELMISFSPLSLLENLSHSVAFCVLSRAGVSHNFPENILKKKLQIQVHVAGEE